MLTTAVWKQLHGIVGQSDDKDLERLVLQMMRLRWAGLIQPTPRKYYDQCGIDLMAIADSQRLTAVVQCKGFKVFECSNQHQRDAAKSIQDFLHSEFIADTYLFVSNRDSRPSGGWQAYDAFVNGLLTGMVQAGKALRAEYWNVHRLLKEHGNDLMAAVEVALKSRSEEIRERDRKFFLCDGPILRFVPLEEKKLRIDGGMPKIEPVLAAQTRPVADIIAEYAKARWTMLIGNFGTGKTTSALQAAMTHQSDATVPTILYAEARALDSTNLRAGLHPLLNQIARTSQPFAEWSDEEELLRRAVPILRSRLSNLNERYILVIDGLDENRSYEDQDGFAALYNQLAELRCPIVITTRREHFAALFEKNAIAIHGLGQKFGPSREARLLVTCLWTEAHVDEYLALFVAAATDLTPSEKDRLLEFVTDFRTRSYRKLYGELPMHPLFLRFILDDVIESGVRISNRGNLLQRAAYRKIARDMANGVDRGIERGADNQSIIPRILRVMENVAFCMAERHDGEIRLMETLSIEEVSEQVTRVIPGLSRPAQDICLASLLVPLGVHRSGHYRIGFIFRTFHEYFLARYVHRTKFVDATVPEEVASYVQELELDNLDLDPIVL